MNLEAHVRLRDTRFGAAWVFECPGCGDTRVQFYRAACLRAARAHVASCAGYSTA